MVRYKQAQILLTYVLETVLLQVLRWSLQKLEGTAKTEKLFSMTLQFAADRAERTGHLRLLLAVFLFSDTLLTLVPYESFSRNAMQVERLSTSVS